MKYPISQHVTVVSNNREEVERYIQNFANKQGIPITANFNGEMICKMPNTTVQDMEDIFMGLFR